jgi:hypothetical protein
MHRARNSGPRSQVIPRWPGGFGDRETGGDQFEAPALVVAGEERARLAGTLAADSQRCESANRRPRSRARRLPATERAGIVTTIIWANLGRKVRGPAAPLPLEPSLSRQDVQVVGSDKAENSEMLDDLVYANGVNGLTGNYLVSPLSISQVADRAKQPTLDRDLEQTIEQVWQLMHQPSFGLPFNVRPEVVAEAGWAIVFGADEADAVKQALDPLIVHRERRIGGHKVKVLDYFSGETWQHWLDRHGVGPGNIDPHKVPYYVLLIGSPRTIPFTFQSLLDIEYAVGRLDFDEAGGYRQYVNTLVDYEESAAVPHTRAAAFFGTRHPFDAATHLSADWLVEPLARSFQPGGPFAESVPAYGIYTYVEQSATKSTMGEILTGTGDLGRPAVFFSATHGMGGWPLGHPDQMTRHGALLCQDWPGLGQVKPVHYFAAADLPRDAHVHGLVAFFFACYGAGTPEVDAFRRTPGELPPAVSEEPFVAALPKALLGHPEGGALAVIGHIERAWGYSFVSRGGAQLVPFQNTMGRILAGQPVGFAMKDFNERYAALSANMSNVLGDLTFGKPTPDAQIAGLWMELSDAQNYVLLGDPAAALKIA